MAAVLLVLGAVAIRERIEKKKASKRMIDDLRYQELQAETERRLSGSGQVIEHDSSSSDGEEGEDQDQVSPPPSYEHVVRTQSTQSARGVDTTAAALPERMERKQSRRQSIRKLMKFG